ncbi:MAG: cell division protein SepF [Clostridiales bacterium]|jgi:FtsZ-interacting cell division protein YlmF|nr:cell division protein SepF [Clostridiales bacterium]
MGAFENFLNKGGNYKKGAQPEFFEDTHDRQGNYRPIPTGVQNYPPYQVTTNNRAELFATPQLQNQHFAREVVSNQYQPNLALQNVVDLQNAQPALQQHANMPYYIGMPLPNTNTETIPRNYQNLVIYQPSTPEDVEVLISYLKRKEPAIVNLDSVDDSRAQRILDYLSGAIFALNGSIQRISSNIFLLCPEGIQITAPLDSVARC